MSQRRSPGAVGAAVGTVAAGPAAVAAVAGVAPPIAVLPEPAAVLAPPVAERRTAALQRRFGRLAPPLMRQAGLYTASQLASRAIPFLLLPVLTRYLTPADYGIVAMFLLVTMLLDPFISIGLAGAVTVKYYEREVDLPAYISTGVALVVALALPAALLVFLLRDGLGDLTAVPGMWLVLVVPLVVARAMVNLLLALLRVRERALQYGIFQNTQSAGLLLLSIGFVVLLGGAAFGRLAAELIATIAFAGVGLVWLWRGGWLRRTFNSSYAGQIGRFGVPLIPHTIGAVLMLQTDRLLLTNMVGISETGLYTVGYQLAVVVELIAVSFNYAYTPWLFKRLTDADETVKRLVRHTYVQFGGLIVLAGAVAFVMPKVASVLLGRDFATSGSYVPWFAIGFMFSGMYYMVTNYIFYAQRTTWLAAVTISVAIINVPLTYALIRINGGMGAAQAMAISFGLSFLGTWFVSQRVYPMPWFHRLRRHVPTAPQPGTDA